jgi:23S rRNA (cytosine1962-C5)-methyltransferase
MHIEDFKNRLRKVQRHIAKWARKNDISCYRIYDNDIPEFPLSIDRYGDALYLAIFHKSALDKDMPLDVWLQEVQAAIAEICGVPQNLHFTKIRMRQKGLNQYEKQDQKGERFIVMENGLKFWVNLADYLDTGLFLDHRQTRQLFRQAAADKDVLNLFAYTGAFSVYAAAGGAKSIRTVDLSNTYLQWAEDNFKLNGFKSTQYIFEQADVMSWIYDATDEAYDLIILDPPTFSNSKRMDKILEIQRDHPMLIRQCMRILRPGGTLFFSTNFRGFKLDEDAFNASSCKEITHLTIPEDFRNKKIHRCWLIQK